MKKKKKRTTATNTEIQSTPLRQKFICPVGSSIAIEGGGGVSNVGARVTNRGKISSI